MANDWKRISPYAIRKPPFYIAKAYVDGCTLYTLSDDNHVRYGTFNSADEAKQYADQLELGNTV